MAKKQNQPNISRPAAVAAQPAKQSTNTKPGMSLATKLCILLGIIAFLLYANTLGNGYVLDDFTVIKNNAIITKGMQAILEIFGTPYRRGWFESHNDLYRPLSLAMFATEWQIGGGSPWPGHFMNILVFAGGVIFLFLFLDKLFEGKRTAVAFLAALLFALHPIHTEVVANIKSRDELLCFFFAFLSLNMFMDYLKGDKMKHLVLGALCFFLSFLSKETVISFIGVIPFIFFFYRNEDKAKSIKITAAAAIVTVLFLGIRYAVLSKYDANTSSEVVFMDNILAKPPSAIAAFATELLILGKYMKMLFVPYPLICDYSYNSIPFTTLGDPFVILSLVAYAGLGVYGIYRLVKTPKDPYAFAILFFMATIALFSNIPFLIGAAMAERFLFFASAGFCLAIAMLVVQFLGSGVWDMPVLQTGKVMGVAVPVCLVFAGIVFNRNKEWLDNPTLFRADVVNAPNDARLNYYLGTELVTENAAREGNPVVRNQIINEGMTYLRKAIEVYPIYDDAHAALGDAYFKINQFDSAEVHNVRALQLNPKFLVAMNNLAGVYFMKHRIDESIRYCKMALAQSPKFVNAYSNLGLCYNTLAINNHDPALFDTAKQYLYKAISANPQFRSTYENMMYSYRGLGQADSARKYELIFKEMGQPQN